MQRKPLLCLTFSLVVTLLLTVGCNSTQNENRPVSDTPPAGGQAAGEKKVLTIAVYDDFYSLETIIDRFTAIHPNVTVELENFKGDEEKYKMQLTTRLLSGKAPDIMDAFLSEEKLSDSGLLADIYPLMRNDPDFNEGDYYMNVIESTVYKGKLITFPITFYYRMVGVNNMFSEELVERFSSYKSISYRQLFDLYNSLEDTGGRYPCWNLDIVTVVLENTNTLIDLEQKKCYFNTPEFIEFITTAKNCTPPQKVAGGRLGYISPAKSSRADQEQYAKQYLFDDAQANQYWFFLPYLEKEVFTHFIPVVNDKNEMRLTLGRRHCINAASQNKELAWEFIKFLTTPQANEKIFLSSFSVNKELFRITAAARIAESAADQERGYTVDGETEQIVEQVIAKLAAYNEMPGEYPLYIGVDIIIDTLTSFYNNIMTAEQAASELQNKISLILME